MCHLQPGRKHMIIKILFAVVIAASLALPAMAQAADR